MRRLFLYLLSISLIAGCSIFRPSPKKTVSEFIESVKKMDSIKVVKLTGGLDVVNTYIGYFDVFYGVLSDDKKRELAGLLLSKLNYEIMGASVEKNSAKVRVKITGVEKSVILEWRSSIEIELREKYRSEWIRKYGLFGPPPPVNFFFLAPVLSEREKNEYGQIAYTKFKNYINKSTVKSMILIFYLDRENSSWIVNEYSEIFEYFL